MVVIADDKLRMQWQKKSWSVPDLLGGKQSYYSLVLLLVERLAENEITDLSGHPDASDLVSVSRSWREYAPFLRGAGLAHNQAGSLRLTSVGRKFSEDPTQRGLADIFQDRFKLFGETLEIIGKTSATVQEVNVTICGLFDLDWKNCSNTRKRMDWLEVLGLIESAGGHKWRITEDGAAALETWELITPKIVMSFEEQADEIRIEEAPSEIKNILQRLREDPSLHRERSKYNIWVPSPNRIDNLRSIATFASDKVSRAELFAFIGDAFGLKQSSIDSMLPFLKASGLIVEVGRSVYISTPAARAWCETGSDLDFIRILHGNMRFVGEMIEFSADAVTRNEMYEAAKKFGLNTEKARWIAGFLQEAGLLEEPRYLQLKATLLGKQFLAELPLAAASVYGQGDSGQSSQGDSSNEKCEKPNEADRIFARLSATARDPLAENEQSGVAFEKAIAEVLFYAGFEVKRIGGSGDTDILVRWKDVDGNVVSATIEAKSKSNGVVTHSDISDVALEAHRDKHSANFTAIIGPGFGGDTIISHARKKGFALITDEELSQIAKTARMLGLDLSETALIFQVPNGLSQFEELIAQRQRRIDLISLAVTTLIMEEDTYGSLSARDLSLLLRNTELAPSIEELIPVLELLASSGVQVLSVSERNNAIEHTAYTISREMTAAYRLAALARAVEEGVKKAR